MSKAVHPNQIKPASYEEARFAYFRSQIDQLEAGVKHWKEPKLKRDIPKSAIDKVVEELRRRIRFYEDAISALDGKRMTDVADDDFGAVLNCAVRYALGRRSYMPGLVIGQIRPMLPEISDKTLCVLRNDIQEAVRNNALGDQQLDAPIWIGFLNHVKEELEKREKQHGRS